MISVDLRGFHPSWRVLEPQELYKTPGILTIGRLGKTLTIIPFDTLAKKGGVHVDAWCTLCTICQDFKQTVLQSLLILEPRVDLSPMTISWGSSVFHVLFTYFMNSSKSEIVGLELLRMMVLTCKVLTETSDGCHIIFDSMPNLTALSFYTSNSKRIFYCSAQLKVPCQHTCMGISLQKALYSGHIHTICAILPTHFCRFRMGISLNQ